MLTAQRREKIATMKWDDIVGQEWRIATVAREKGTGGALVLPDMAADIIKAQPQFVDNPYVFTARGGTAALQRVFACDGRLRQELPGLKPWVIHDLRRTPAR